MTTERCGARLPERDYVRTIMRSIVLRSALLLAVLAGVSAPPAMAARAPQPFVRLAGSVVGIADVSDRYLVVASPATGQDRSREVRVLDTKTRRVRSLPVPQGCWINGYTPQTAGERLLLWCDSGSALMDVRSGRIVEEGLRPVRQDGVVQPDGQWSAIGTSWLAEGYEYRNRETGEVRILGDPPVASRLRNLDSADLSLLGFCAPFASKYRVLPTQQAGGRLVYTSHNKGHLLLGRCGVSRVKDLSGGPAASDGSLAHGYTAWAAARRGSGSCKRGVGFHSVAQDRTAWWPRTNVKGCIDFVRHTKYAVVVGTYIGVDPDDLDSPPADLFRLWVAPRPR